MLSRGPEDHDVVFCSRDDELARQASEYLLGAMRDNGTGVVLATPQHRTAIEARMAQAGVSLTAARARGAYVALDAGEVMSRFMINGFADPAAFWLAVSPVIKKAARNRRKVAVFGEMVALLWGSGLAGAAVDLEALWNELATQYSFSLLCAYPADVLSDSAHADELVALMDAHAGPEQDGARVTAR